MNHGGLSSSSCPHCSANVYFDGPILDPDGLEDWQLNAVPCGAGSQPAWAGKNACVFESTRQAKSLPHDRTDSPRVAWGVKEYMGQSK